MKRMRILVLAVVTSLLGCASTGRTGVEPVEVASASALPSAEPAAEAEPVLQTHDPSADPPASRPRLSHTVTLGHQNDEATYSGDRPAPAREPGPQVVVNNQIVMQGGVPAYGYGGYGYGYGYGGHRGVGRSDGFAPRSSPSRFQWGQSGFEGARRTAAPGQTPAIGGNWSPPPSYGPAPMR